MALAISKADTSIWASGAAEAAERPPGLTAAAAPLNADHRPCPTVTIRANVVMGAGVGSGGG